jgi:putative transcriptional regulator
LENINLTGHILIAMPSMTDPHFSKTITLICTHNQDGAMGVVINRPIELDIANLFKQMDLEASNSSLLDRTLYFGGPVQQDRGFILHVPQQEYNATILVNDNIALTTSKDILEATAQNEGPEKILIALGYAGWTPGQLEDEMANNAWLNVNLSKKHDLHQLVFETPNANKFNLAMHTMGLTLSNLSDVAGHA